LFIRRLPPPSVGEPVGRLVVTHNANTMKLKTTQLPLKFIVLLMALFLVSGVQAQSSCGSALVIQVNSVDTFYMGDSEMWFRFQATTNEVHVFVSTPTQTPRAGIQSVQLFGGDCQNLSPLEAATYNGFFVISNTNLIVSNHYFIRVNSDSIGYLSITLAEQNIVLYEDTDCPEDPCINLLGNGDFEATSSLVIHQFVNGIPNTLWAHPFNHIILDKYAVHGAIGTYQDPVCRWRTLTDADADANPFSQIYTPSVPFTTQDISGQYAARLFAIGNLGNTDGRPITNRVNLLNGKTYEISFNYKINHQGAAVFYNPQLKIGFSPDTHPTSLNNIQYIQNPSSPVFNSTYWTHESFQFTATADFNSIIIHSYIGMSTSCTENRVYIDDVAVRPVIECPIVEGPMFICDNTTLITYNITNYFPGVPYYYRINNDPTIKITTNPFVVDISNHQVNKITLMVNTECLDCPYEITTYISCDPDTSLPVTMDHTFHHGDVINQSLFIGENIFICGQVTTGQDVTFWDCNVYFAPMAKITVSPSTTLTIEYSNLTNGCDYFWDGVYAEDETASIIVKNNTAFSFAKNAIVSANKSTLDVTDAEFTDNLIGIHIRKYNPYYLPDQSPDGTPLPPPHTAYIAGCKFEMINATNASQFLNEFIFPVSVPPTVGIKIDTVYNVTIGDHASVAKRNYFLDLAFGIHAIWSDITVINGQFDDIKRLHYSPPYVNSYNRPLEGAIHCNRPLVHAGSVSLEMFASAITGRAIIGGHGLKGNYFNNCRHGIYAYKHQLIAINNHFDEQHYNAVFVDEGRHGCQVSFNTISMKDPLWASNKIHNASILFYRAKQAFGGINTDIIGNTINNTRIGIYALNHTSNPQATCTKCTRIGSNEIYFDNMIDFTREYCGIYLINGNYARVAGNHIENQATAYSNPAHSIQDAPPGNIVTGIRVDQSADAWIYDNHQIVKMSHGISAIGVCYNTQFSCNDLINCRSGIYFYPNSATAATLISQQGWSGRASDNYWLNTNDYRIDGELNMPPGSVDWYFRGDDVTSNPYATFLLLGDPMYDWIFPRPNTDVASYCVGLPFPGIGDDPGGEIREMRYGDIVRENLTFDVLEEEFEQMCIEYLYEILYTNPDVMNIGEPGDTLYQNFFNYLTNSTIAEFTIIHELMDEENFAQALLDNGQVIATTMIDQNRQLTNDIYLRSVAVDAEIDSVDIQALLAIALLTPYIGGDGVYAARVMLGIDPYDYGLPYRKGNEAQAIVQKSTDILVYPNPASESITFEVVNVNLQEPFNLRIFSANGILALNHHGLDESIFTIPINTLKPGIYYYLYTTKSGNNASGRFIKK
jgi:hypothetical protein